MRTQGRRKAIIIGGSLGGLFAAGCLRKVGCEVEVFEKTGDDLATRGAGLGTHDELFAALEHLGIHLEAQLKPREQRTPEELVQRPELVMRQVSARLSEIPSMSWLTDLPKSSGRVKTWVAGDAL